MQQGKTLEFVAWRNPFSASEISKKIKTGRHSISNWFHKESLNNELIYKIGKMLNKNLSAKYPNLSDKQDRQPFLSNQWVWNQSTEKIQLESVLYWRNKYITFVEAHDEVLRHGPIDPTSYQNNKQPS
jgi:hypothetical protein